MAERRQQYPEHELAAALHALGKQIIYPPTPDLAPAVRRELLANPPVSRKPWRKPLFQPRQLVTIAVAILLLATLVVAIIPGARTAVAGWLSIPGVIFSESAPAIEITPIGNWYRIGRPVTLDEAREQAPYSVLVPTQPGLEEPDEVWLDPIAVDGAVWLVYHADAQLPQASATGAGLLLSQFRGELNPGMYGKGIPAGTQVEELTLNGEPAYWITGDPHTFSYFDPDGRAAQDTIRLAGNTLLWQQGDLTLRLESALDRDSVIEIAESMR